MGNPLDPDRVPHVNPGDAAVPVPKPRPETTGNPPTTHLELSPESPSLPRRNCPHGARRPKREHALDACLRPGAERQGHPSQGAVQGPGGLAAQVIDQLAQLIVRAHERDGDNN